MTTVQNNNKQQTTAQAMHYLLKPPKLGGPLEHFSIHRRAPAHATDRAGVTCDMRTYVVGLAKQPLHCARQADPRGHWGSRLLGTELTMSRAWELGL